MNYQDREDYFDRLPDALVRLIFNKVHDAASLCRSMAVSKRFASIVSETDTVHLLIRLRQIHDGTSISSEELIEEASDLRSATVSSMNILKTLVKNVVAKLFRFIQPPVVANPSPRISREEDYAYPYHSPKECLKNFDEIQSLRIVIPGDGRENGPEGSDSLFRWKLEFGSELESCVMVVATSVTKRAQNCNASGEEYQPCRPMLDDDKMRLRISWMRSCLMAAYKWHNMLRKIVRDHRMLREIVVAEASGQGRLCVGGEQIERLRGRAKPPRRSNGGRALRMKVWYVPRLGLPASEIAMEGATLVLIRPAAVENDEDILERAFEWEGKRKIAY